MQSRRGLVFDFYSDAEAHGQNRVSPSCERWERQRERREWQTHRALDERVAEADRQLSSLSKELDGSLPLSLGLWPSPSLY